MPFSPRRSESSLLPLNLGKLAEVPIPPEKVEGVEQQAGPDCPRRVRPGVLRSLSGLRG